MVSNRTSRIYERINFDILFLGGLVATDLQQYNRFTIYGIVDAVAGAIVDFQLNNTVTQGLAPKLPSFTRFSLALILACVLRHVKDCIDHFIHVPHFGKEGCLCGVGHEG